MNLYAVIMAGGVGSRFWPRSRKATPKQLLKIFGNQTMIQETVGRLEGLVPDKNIFVITNEEQSEKIKEQLSKIPEENIIAEPFGKNTAPCIGLAATIIKHKDPEGVLIILPADHLIPDVKKFQKVIRTAVKFAESSDGLVTIGIEPTRPETGYGYIQYLENGVDKGVFAVKSFAEKPNLNTAQRFLESGDFLWNSGMFIWRADSILNEMKALMPDLHEGLIRLSKSIDTDDFYTELRKVYGQVRSISIDYGIMEKSKHVYLVKGDFGWSDVGSWETVYQLSDKNHYENSISGDVFDSSTKNSYIFSDKKFTAVIGVENLIIINTEDSLLICDRKNAQDVKLVVDYLKMNNRDELL
ncbi:MAG: NTP transferase domain-containing protein [Melioribacteraceae bacterium]|nr:NTP transferase domain-containing protein [Melioribacteraceae bacterium]MCO6472416.1 mannose-1-phosphate guanylyltransferase [Melioribacteraceae bacterium]MDD3558644.1 mannose-1-phosphate guanylyltransferase [Melioribacteraceae bacterium]